jgi:hypothetical protein
MRQALESEHRAEWQRAMEEEHRSIDRAETYELVERDLKEGKS